MRFRWLFAILYPLALLSFPSVALAQVGVVDRLSVDSVGTQVNGTSSRAAISADGRFVAFESIANNLVAGDTNGTFDIFVHDRNTGETTRVSIPNLADQDVLGTQGNGISFNAAISADGRFVAFESLATNLVTGDTNGTTDIFRVETGFAADPLPASSPFEGDFNGDGTSDILWRKSDGQLVIWQMNGLQITTIADYGVVSLAWTVVGVGDFNGDGTSDILWRKADGQLVIWQMNGLQITTFADFGLVPNEWQVQ